MTMIQYIRNQFRMLRAAWTLVRARRVMLPILRRVRKDSADPFHFARRVSMLLAFMASDLDPDDRFLLHYVQDPYMLELMIANDEGRPLDEVPSTEKLFAEGRDMLGVTVH